MHKRRVTERESRKEAKTNQEKGDVTFTKGIYITCLNTLIFKRKNQPRETGMEHTYPEDIFLIYLGSYSMPIFTSNLLGND